MTPDSIPPILWTWALFSPLLFRLIPGREAAIACLLVGWAFLPIGFYPASNFSESLAAGEGGSAHAVAVPAWPLSSKAAAVGLGCLGGMVLFDRRSLGRLKFQKSDLPMVVWCFLPIASAIANGLPVAEGLAQARYLALAWGIPYLVGRVYLVDSESDRRFLLGLVAAGLVYLPFCAIESAIGPRLYGLVYGPHPYQIEGASRAIGYRPLVFLEHGNQLGMWMASSAVAATWLWAAGAVRKPWGIPGGILAGVLVASTFLFQSLISILLMVLALLPLIAGRVSRIDRNWRVWVWSALGFLGLILILMAARKGFDPSAIRLEARDLFRSLGKSSFTWRLARSEEFLPVALARPILGWARVDWGPGGQPFLNPVNLGFWLLAFGMSGVIGLVASMAIWLGPVFRRFDGLRIRQWLNPSRGPSIAIGLLLVIHVLDGFNNAVLILPLLVGAGGLNRPAGP